MIRQSRPMMVGRGLVVRWRTRMVCGVPTAASLCLRGNLLRSLRSEPHVQLPSRQALCTSLSEADSDSIHDTEIKYRHAVWILDGLSVFRNFARTDLDGYSPKKDQTSSRQISQSQISGKVVLSFTSEPREPSLDYNLRTSISITHPTSPHVSCSIFNNVNHRSNSHLRDYSLRQCLHRGFRPNLPLSTE